MTDKLSAERRSENMRKIKAKETKPELAVRAVLRELGVRYRLHANELPGKPDIVRRRDKRAILVHGCFWHQHAAAGCLDGRKPKSNSSYWNAKLAANVVRDRKNLAALKALGWRVLTVWDCELNRPAWVRARLKAFFTESERLPGSKR